MPKRNTILIVDDSKLVRSFLVHMLSDDYNVLEGDDGTFVVAQLEKNHDEIAAILLDIVMPHMDGFQVLTYMHNKDMLRTIPVLMITAEESDRYITLAYDLGVSDVIHKPFSSSVVRRRLKNILDLYEHKYHLEGIIELQKHSLEEKTAKMLETNNLMIDMLGTVIEYRNLESGQHIRRIRGLTTILLTRLASEHSQYSFSNSDIEMISHAAALHDIGKIAIPDSVLLKPGKLTTEEFEMMKTHTVKGGEILNHLNGMDDKQYLSYCRDVCLFHHERWDGKGYPLGLTGNKIPIPAQVVSVADVYDALTHKRIYKPAYSFEQAQYMIINGECGAFSDYLMDAFKKSLPQFEKFVLDNQDGSVPG